MWVPASVHSTGTWSTSLMADVWKRNAVQCGQRPRRQMSRNSTSVDDLEGLSVDNQPRGGGPRCILMYNGTSPPPGYRVPAIRRRLQRDPWPIRRRPPGYPRADDHRAIREQTTTGPSASRRPPGHPRADDHRAIREQTTTRPSASRRPPGHPRADDHRAIREQTTTGSSARGRHRVELLDFRRVETQPNDRLCRVPAHRGARTLVVRSIRTEALIR